MPSVEVVLISGASSGFGRETAVSLARAGNVVFAGMRAIDGRNAANRTALDELARAEGLELRAVDLDVQSERSVDDAVEHVLQEHGRLDVLVQNAGHMAYGPAEAFTPDQFAHLYDVNVLGAHRLARAVLPQMRAQREGFIVWVGSSSTRGGHPPFLAPYFAAKAGMDALAESYAAESIRFGVESTIVVPGAFTTGTNHFTNASVPDDTARVIEHDAEYGALRQELTGRLSAIVPVDADVQQVADEIVRLVGLPRGTRPFRTHVDPSRDGSEVVSTVADRIRAEFYHRIGIEDLLSANAAR